MAQGRYDGAMRWSWPAFTAGAAAGALLVLLLLGGHVPDEPRAAAPAGRAAAVVAPEPLASPRVRPRDEAPPAESVAMTVEEASAPAAGPVEGGAEPAGGEEAAPAQGAILWNAEGAQLKVSGRIV